MTRCTGHSGSAAGCNEVLPCFRDHQVWMLFRLLSYTIENKLTHGCCICDTSTCSICPRCANVFSPSMAWVAQKQVTVSHPFEHIWLHQYPNLAISWRSSYLVIVQLPTRYYGMIDQYMRKAEA